MSYCSSFLPKPPHHIATSRPCHKGIHLRTLAQNVNPLAGGAASSCGKPEATDFKALSLFQLLLAYLHPRRRSLKFILIPKKIDVVQINPLRARRYSIIGNQIGTLHLADRCII